MDINEVLVVLSEIEQDDTVPRNIRSKVREATVILQEPTVRTKRVKVDHIIQELDDLGNDPNLPAHTRTQIWEVISNLESV